MASRAIHEATRHQDYELLTRLLKNDPKLIHAQDDVGRTPLMMAALRGHDEISSWLLDHGSRIDQVRKLRRSVCSC